MDGNSPVDATEKVSLSKASLIPASPVISYQDGTWARLPYDKTGYFSPIVTDYLTRHADLQPFYQHPVSTQGIAQALQARHQYETPRKILVEHLQEQYNIVSSPSRVAENIQSLLDPNTFTVCTAHQPALFTGPLYVIYKIIHTLQLAQQLDKYFPGKKFVPVFWMGSEDADLEELGSFFLGQTKLTWTTTQTGAVGRMKTTGLETLIQRVAGELGVLPHGPQLIKGLQEAYAGKNTDLQTGTFRFLHHLFGAFGLVVLLPDHARLKSLLKSICEDDLFRQTPYTVVQQTVQQLQENYEVQARPRPINLFYLKEQIRNRIEQKGDQYVVVDTALQFTKEQLRQELTAHPERFSPNVILRGLFQEMILPNVATIGGGGELAYWLELKGLFDHYRVPYPVVVLRNSFLLVPQAISSRMTKLELSAKDFFQSPENLLKQIAQRESGARLQLEEEKVTSRAFYDALKKKSRQIDPTLEKHVDALGARALNRLEELEKKLIRSEKKKYEWERDQITQIKSALFPGNGLQERTENFMPYYARYGAAFLEQLLQHSLSLEQQFQIWELPEAVTGKP